MCQLRIPIKLIEGWNKKILVQSKYFWCWLWWFQIPDIGQFVVTLQLHLKTVKRNQRFCTSMEPVMITITLCLCHVLNHVCIRPMLKFKGINHTYNLCEASMSFLLDVT